MNASTVRDERLQMLGPQHAAAMYEIERQCFPLPWSEEQCAAAFGQKAFLALGMFRHEALIGYISVYHTLDELEILNLAVLPDERRRGHGRRILGVVLRLARKMAINKILLEVRVGNRPAICLYESCGFKREGVRKKYYTDTGEDALIYLCSI